MKAKEIGEYVKECAEMLVATHIDEALGDQTNIETLDVIGSSLIMQGAMLMLEAGCPSDIVLARVISCVETYKKRQVQEEAVAGKSSLIVI